MFWMIYLVFQKFGFLGILGPPETTLANGLETSVEGRIANFDIFLEIFYVLRFA